MTKYNYQRYSSSVVDYKLEKERYSLGYGSTVKERYFGVDTNNPWSTDIGKDFNTGSYDILNSMHPDYGRKGIVPFIINPDTLTFENRTPSNPGAGVWVITNLFKVNETYGSNVWEYPTCVGTRQASETNTPFNLTPYPLYMIRITSNLRRDLVYDEKSVVYRLFRVPIYGKGSYVDVISAEEGVYPDNGMHSDGYWYVKAGKSNLPPTAPTSITYPALVLGGESINIEWTASIDSDGSILKYELERKYGSSAWSLVTSTASRSYTDTINRGATSVQYQVRAIDNQNTTSEWTLSATRNIKVNQPPIIKNSDGSQKDQDLGEKNNQFALNFTISDPDQDAVKVDISLNGILKNTTNNIEKDVQQSFTITQEDINNFNIDEQNILEIKATDPYNGISYRRYTFIRKNAPPKVIISNTNLGQKSDAFSVTVQIEDPEGDPVTAVAKIGNRVIDTRTLTTAGSFLIAVSKEVFLELPRGRNVLRIEATDDKNATGVGNLEFERVVTYAEEEFKTPYETDTYIKMVYLSNTSWYLADGAKLSIKASNNAFDVNPTWEDITNAVLQGGTANLTNTTKTAEKWGGSIKIRIDRQTATEDSWISSKIGGSFA